MNRYVVASSKDWFRRHAKSAAFRALDVHDIDDRSALTVEGLKRINPRYVFIPHWNWILPKDIYERFECIAFHTAPLPYGRGGSPIQNLIIRGFETAPVCAFRVTSVLDGGPIYGKHYVQLSGTIEEIFSRIAGCVEQLILSICVNHPQPTEQSGDVVQFKRLAPADNELLPSLSMKETYDRIRMVDGLDYPRAYVTVGGGRIEFSDARISDGKLTARSEFVFPSDSR